jgi:hypothetical protein
MDKARRSPENPSGPDSEQDERAVFPGMANIAAMEELAEMKGIA